jgi:hypothetical protein
VNIVELETLLKNPGFRCEGMYGECGMRPAHEIPCRTQYCEAEMNIAPVLCEDCARDYNDYWDEMWAGYHGVPISYYKRNTR